MFVRQDAIAHHARTIGYDLAPGEVDAVYLCFIQAADEAEAAVPEHEVNAIIEEVASKAPAVC
ncbi:MAG: hypothetical protein QGD90_02340 [Candidatus Hydrogenedentes bacterium]|nr:hypothetical protein [Candidatus Hydrogenedentota bacterium]